MSVELVAVLRECQAAFSGPAGTERNARQWTDLCAKLLTAELAAGAAWGIEAQSEVPLLAERLVGFNAACKQHSFAALAGEAARSKHLAAMHCVCTCMRAAAALPPQDAYRASASAAAVFESGRVVLSIEARLGSDLLVRHLERQLDAAATTLSSLLNYPAQQAAAAAFAGTVARPPVLLAWLKEAAAALAALPAHGMSLHIAHSFCGTVHSLLLPPFSKHAAALAASPALCDTIAEVLLQHCLPALASAVEASPEQLLLQLHQARTLLTLASSLQPPSMLPAVRRSLQQHGNGSAMAQLVRTLARALPTQVPASVTPVMHAAAHESAVMLLCTLCSALFDERGSGDSPSSGSTSTGQIASAASSPSGSMRQQPGGSGASCGSGSSDSSTTAGGSSITGQQGPGSDSSAGGVQQEQEAVALAVAELLPHTAAVCASLANASAAACLPHLSDICSMLPKCVSTLAVLHGRCLSQGQLAAWSEAAEAGLRLQPLLAQLDRQWRQQQLQQQQQQQGPPAAQSPSKQQQQADGQRQEGEGAEQPGQPAQPAVSSYAALSGTLFNMLWLRLPALIAPVKCPAAPKPVRVAGQSLWQLHSAACRLVHWLSASSNHELAACGTLGASEWRLLLSGLNWVCLLAHCCMERPSQPQHAEGLAGTPQELRALCAAHWRAMQTAMDAAAAAEVHAGGATVLEPSGSLRKRGEQAKAALAAVFEVARSCPDLLDGAAGGVLVQLLQAWQVLLAAAPVEELEVLLGKAESCMLSSSSSLDALAAAAKAASSKLLQAAVPAYGTAEDADSSSAAATDWRSAGGGHKWTCAALAALAAEAATPPRSL
ncbi:hypothetical protein ABPG75_010111 [Micractinium tetrahymenae]